MSKIYDVKNSANNVKGLFQNPRTRFTMIVMLGVVAVVAIVFFMSLGGNSREAAQQEGAARVTTRADVEARPGTNTDPGYNQAVQDQNQQQLQAAQNQGGSFLPTPTVDRPAPSLDPLANLQQPQQTTATPPPVFVQPQPVAPVQQRSVVQQPQVNEDLSRTERYAQVEAQIQAYMQSWAAPAGGQEFNYVGERPEVREVTGSASAQPATAEGLADEEQRQGARYVRAGTIVPAVLLTPIDSDSPGPVLAQIVSGPLTGSRLIGTYEATESSVVVRFQTISMPQEPSSFRVNAFAVDENLSVGLATDVNRRYFRRYGLLLASGFLQGYSQAVARSGTTTTVTDGGGVIVSQDDIDAGQINKIALGQAGAAVANDVQRASDVQPRIRVQGEDGRGGVAIGLLFMNDF